MEVKALKESERLYTYTGSQQISSQTGYIGYLRGDFGSSGDRFYSTWFDVRADRKSPAFLSVADYTVNTLREDGQLLHSLPDMKEFVSRYPESAFEGNYTTEYGFRVDIGEYAMLIRCNPNHGDYNFYCNFYIAQWLDSHIRKAANGIRFTDAAYDEIFRVSDGGAIVITDAAGQAEERTCRYIDDYHMEVGPVLYHTHQFAEVMEAQNKTYRPKEERR